MRKYLLLDSSHREVIDHTDLTSGYSFSSMRNPIRASPLWDGYETSVYSGGFMLLQVEFYYPPFLVYDPSFITSSFFYD